MMSEKAKHSKKHIPIRTAIHSGWNRCDDLYWQEWERVNALKENIADTAERAFWTGIENTGLWTGYKECKKRMG